MAKLKSSRVHGDLLVDGVIYQDNGASRRIMLQGYTGSSSTWWYYPLARFPLAYDSSSNYASLLVVGRMGGWTESNISLTHALLGNRTSENGNVINMGRDEVGLDMCRLQMYRQSDDTALVYLAVKGYYAYDITVSAWRCELTYSGSYVSSPSGELKWDSYTTDNRLGVYNSGGKIGNKTIVTQ